MALVRATLQTALPTVRTLIGDLKKLARETGSSPAIDTLAQNLDALDEYGSRKAIEVEVITTAPLEPDEANRIATWLGVGVHPSQLQPAPGNVNVIDVPGPPLDLRVQIRAASTRTAMRVSCTRTRTGRTCITGTSTARRSRRLPRAHLKNPPVAPLAPSSRSLRCEISPYRPIWLRFRALASGRIRVRMLGPDF